jgi:branched-chain amino acid transport system substrate-binding protein
VVLERIVINVEQCGGRNETGGKNMRKGCAIWCGVLLLLLGVTGCELKEKEDEPAGREVTIGALLPLSGELSSMGESSQAALQIALEEVNEFLKKTKADYVFRLETADTQTNPLTALEEARKLEKTANIMIGPMSSGEISQLQEWANHTDVLLLNQSSTATTLAIPDDNIYRFVPSDLEQADALSALILQEGAEAVIPLYRADDYGAGMVELVSRSLKNSGLQIGEGVPYQSGDPYSAAIHSVTEQLELYSAQYKKERIAVLLISFDEAVELFKEAAQHPELSTVRWFGSDGNVLNKDIIEQTQAAQFAEKVRFSGTTYAADETVIYNKVKEKIQDRIGREPETSAIFAYDIMWAISDLYEKVGIDAEFDELKRSLPSVAKDHVGATGWLVLNDNGDRMYSIYQVWQVERFGETYQWSQYAKYRRDPGLPGMITLQ